MKSKEARLFLRFGQMGWEGPNRFGRWELCTAPIAKTNPLASDAVHYPRAEKQNHRDHRSEARIRCL